VEEARISPRRAEEKNAVVQAVHTTCFVRGDQEVRRILSPITSRRGNCITLLVEGRGGEEKERFVAPLSTILIIGSFKASKHGTSLMRWTNLMAAM